MVGTLIVTGVFNGWAQVTAPEAIDTPYGSALAVKTALVAVLLLFGAFNLWWVRPRLARDHSSEGWLSRSVGVEVLLALLVLGSVGFLTSVEPARQVASRAGAGEHPTSLNFQDTAEGVDISLEIAPGTVGANELTVSLTDRLGNPVDNASVVDIRLSYLDADLGEETVPAGPGGDGSYLAAAQPLTIAGAWQAELIVRRPDAFDARTAFRFEIAATAAQGSSAISPSPKTAKIMLGVGLALLGLLFMGAGVRLGGWFSRTGAGVMAPGLGRFRRGRGPAGQHPVGTTGTTGVAQPVPAQPGVPPGWQAGVPATLRDMPRPGRSRRRPIGGRTEAPARQLGGACAAACRRRPVRLHPRRHRGHGHDPSGRGSNRRRDLARRQPHQDVRRIGGEE